MLKASFIPVALALLGFGARSWAAPADSLGLAESKVQYKIARADSLVDAHADTFTKVINGDRVQAAEQPVRIQTSGGDTVMVQTNSSAEFAGGEKINVVSGDVLVAVGKESHLTVGIDELLISPLSVAKTGTQRIVAVARPSEDYVKISGFSQPVAIKTAGSDDQLAVVGANDSVELSKTPKGWVVVQASNGKPTTKPAGPAGPGYKAGNPNDPNKKEEDRRRAGYWWWVPIAGLGLAGVIVGTGVIIRDANDDDNNSNNDDDRGPTSRINRPGNGNGGGNGNGNGNGHHHNTGGELVGAN